MPVDAPRCHALVPCAGSGSRAGTAQPKQYQLLAGRPLVRHTLDALAQVARIGRVLVVAAPGDATLRVADAAWEWVDCGGATRAESVFNGLAHLRATGTPDTDWVLVHDAARPCLRSSDLTRLIDELVNDEVGGLLAAPSVDTLKRADGADRVVETVTRDLLWRALTPQMFRFGLLRQALMLAVDNNVVVTDESQAIEGLGLRPRLVSGDPDNIKITTAGDFERAERILRARTKSAPAAP